MPNDDLAVKVGDRSVAPALSGCIPVLPTLPVVPADVHPTHLELRTAGSVQLVCVKLVNK